MHLMGEGGELGRPSEFKLLALRKPNGGNLYLYRILSVYAGARCFDDVSKS